jgi:hypothetical protein
MNKKLIAGSLLIVTALAGTALAAKPRKQTTVLDPFMGPSPYVLDPVVVMPMGPAPFVVSEPVRPPFRPPIRSPFTP